MCFICNEHKSVSYNSELIGDEKFNYKLFHDFHKDTLHKLSDLQ